ncbi:MAG: LamG domain-containing protein [Phycisphaerales bacterium]|nr:MAG: LamG domain-containing protein [Phycisphaerales bacterium]
MGAANKILVLTALSANLILTGVGIGSTREGLIGYWPYNGDTLDYSGLDNHGTAFGNPSFVGGKVGLKALNFDGNDYVRMDGVSDDITSNNVTLSGWVRTTDNDGDWFSCNTGSGGNVALWAITSGRAAMYESSYEGKSTTPVSDGNWHMLTYVRSGSTGYIYVDGVQENTHSASFNFSAGDRWSIAQEWDGDNPSDFLAGTVDEVAMWDRALTIEEVAYLYNHGQGNTPLAGPYVGITESSGETSVKEGGATDSYEIKLNSEPVADVQIVAKPDDDQIDLGAGPGASVVLTFTASNWSVPQAITVTAFDDDVYEGKVSHTTTVTHSSISADRDYNAIVIAPVEVSVTDDELTCGDWGYLPSDFNRDCYVNLADFMIFAKLWLETGSD